MTISSRPPSGRKGPFPLITSPNSLIVILLILLTINIVKGEDEDEGDCLTVEEYEEMSCTGGEAKVGEVGKGAKETNGRCTLGG